MLLCGSLTGCFSAPPQVVALEPNNGSNNIAADAQVRVRFDRPVTAASLQSRFHIDPPVPHCAVPGAWSAAAGAPCRLRLLEGGVVLQFDHKAAPFVADTKYTLRLDGGFQDTEGGSNSLDHRWELTTGAPPRVASFTPSNGSGDVAADASLAITFNAYMTAESVQAAVHLEPAVPDTRVYRNAHDHGRFVVLPGRLLTPGTAYTLSVSPAATEEHGLTLAGRVAARFTVAGLGHEGHSLVLAAPSAAAAADQVLLTALGPRVPGDPVSAASIYEAPRCLLASCGAIDFGKPTLSIAEAAISPDAQHLALVLVDRESPGPPRLVVQPTEGGPTRLLGTGASHISWSPDSTRLAYAVGPAIHVVSAANGADLTLPPGLPLSAPAIWEPGGSRLVLPVGSPGDPAVTRGIDLADASLGIRYPLPLLSGPLSAPALNPSGSRLAVRRDGTAATEGAWTIFLGGNAGGPTRLASDLTPVAWTGDGTLLAVAAGRSAMGLVRLNVASGDRTPISGVGPAELSSLVATASGRQLAYLHGDAAGVTQAFIENADGSNPTPLTTFPPSDRVAVAVSVSG
ncbi:MAG: hypothetical protein NVSMB29_09200 [Candidatus Dormibacteria bacterium]